MLAMTEAAGRHLAGILAQPELPEEITIRLVFDDAALSMQPDQERTGDTLFEHDGRTVLVLDAKVSELLDEDTLDVDGEKLTLIRGGDEDTAPPSPDA